MTLTRERDPITRWWRGISLRAKITGVTVAVLALGLLSAGLGAMPFLHGAFVTQIDESLEQSASDSLANQLFVVSPAGKGYVAIARTPVPGGTAPFAALYAQDGALLAQGGRKEKARPAFDKTVRLEDSYDSTAAFSLNSTTGEDDAYRAVMRVVPMAVNGTDVLFTMVIAAPTSTADRNIATYLAIFTALASVTMVVGALLTRWAVTLAFRRLGQVETTAMAIAAGNFTQRMPDAEPRTEVGRLKLAINTMLGRLDAALVQRDASVTQMRRFVGDASHELRTPLVTVRGYAELYRMGAIRGEEATGQAMDRIEKEAIRMGNLVEDLLALARLDERRPVVFADVDLRPIARDAALDLRATAPDRVATYVDVTARSATAMPAPEAAEETADGARRRPTGATALTATLGRFRRRPKADGSPPTPASGQRITAGGESAPAPFAALRPAHAGFVTLPIVLGEEDKIRQVVTNLVGNARRYTPDDSPLEIAVGVDASGEYGWIAVIDHGDGIPPQQREQIFQRFWRADTSRARETGGSGLGLAIVASIVDALHGKIAVDETPGGGATFRVSFPLSQHRAPEEHLFIETQPLERLKLDADGNPLPPPGIPPR